MQPVLYGARSAVSGGGCWRLVQKLTDFCCAHACACAEAS